MTTIFREDECLRFDPDYPGIRGWWKENFNRNFRIDWDIAVDTEIDGGDNFTRVLWVDGVRYFVTYDCNGCYTVRT